MIRERIGQAALRAYPPAVRQARGLEMLGMLLDTVERSRVALVRESGSLVLGGLRERRAITARAGTRRLLADSCCQAVLVFLTLWIISAVNTEGIAGPSQLVVQAVVLAAILACALIGYERIAAISGAPQQRPRDPRQLLWLVPVCVLAALPAHAQVSLPAVLAVISIGGLLRLLHDPRLAIACSLVSILLLSTDASRPAPAGLGLLDVAAGLMLTIAAGRLWIMRHRATA